MDAGAGHDAAGDIPRYLHALDGNASDKVSLVEAVEALGEQLQGEGETPIFVADSGMYSAANMARLNRAQVRWISRVPETSVEAKAAVREADAAAWQQEGELWWAPVAAAPQGERWVVGRTVQGEERARATLARKAEQIRVEWEKTLWHLLGQGRLCARRTGGPGQAAHQAPGVAPGGGAPGGPSHP